MAVATQRTPLAEREVLITRLLGAPRLLVFNAWTDGKQLAQWWGPAGFTNPVCQIDARVGGIIRIQMRSPDGAVYPMKGTVKEIMRPRRFAFSNVAVDADDNPLLEGLTTATFAEDGGKTKLTLHARSGAVAAVAVDYLKGMEAGWTQSIDKLAALMNGVL